jgi:hypothetical protein
MLVWCRTSSRADHWEFLCPDVRGLVLRKLSLHDLACAAATSREFKEVYKTRLTEEQAALISVGEVTFGKDMFWAFVGAFQQAMWGLEPHTGVMLGVVMRSMIIDATGGVVAKDGVHIGRFTGAAIGGCICACSNTVFEAVLSAPPETCGTMSDSHVTRAKLSPIIMNVSQIPDGGVRLEALFSKEATVGAVALLLAICTATTGVPASWKGPLNAVHLTIRGLAGGDAGKGEVQRLVGPLRSLAMSFMLNRPLNNSACRL